MPHISCPYSLSGVTGLPESDRHHHNHSFIGATGLEGLCGCSGLSGNRGYRGCTGLMGNTGLIGVPGGTINDCAYIFNSKSRAVNDLIILPSNTNLPLDSKTAGGLVPINTNPDLFTINSDNIEIKQTGTFKISAYLSIIYQPFQRNGIRIVSNLFNSAMFTNESRTLAVEIVRRVEILNGQSVSISLQPVGDLISGNTITTLGEIIDTNFVTASLKIIKIA